MAAAGDNNYAGAYYFGRPTNYDAQKPPVPPLAKEPVDDKVNAPPVQGVPGYYVDRVRPAASDQTSDSANHDTEPGFFAKCLVCFSGGGRNQR